MARHLAARFPSSALSRRTLLAQAVSGAALWLAGCRSSAPTTGPAPASGSGAATETNVPTDEMHATRLLQQHSAVDMHSHPGRFFLKDTAPLDPSLAPLMSMVTPETLAGLERGHVAAAVFNTVADLRALSVVPPGALVAHRPLAAGEAYEDHRRQVRAFQSLVTAGHLQAVLAPADVDLARNAGVVGGLLGAEGADFLEGRLERLEEAWHDGVRLVGLVHYRRNELGDVQTEPATPGGLTEFGERVVHEMNRLGMVIDLAHSTTAVLRRTLEISSTPVIVSHVMVARPGVAHARSLSEEDAKRVAANGGVIGAWPAGIGLASFDDYVAEIVRLVELLGVEHVGIGTDMDANFRPVFTDYAAFPRIPAALMARGMREDDVARVVGGNFLRVFGAVSSSRSLG
jgi:membrane dipeptidase